jgi:chemotaxis response regulator CheB
MEDANIRILSGVMSDGIAGLWEIKNAGGVAIIQPPDDARMSAMPQSALDSVSVDHCVPAAEIGPLSRRRPRARRERPFMSRTATPRCHGV